MSSPFALVTLLGAMINDPLDHESVAGRPVSVAGLPPFFVFVRSVFSTRRTTIEFENRVG